MPDQTELRLLRDSARGALSIYPDGLRLAPGEDVAPSIVRDVMRTAAAQGWTSMLLPEHLGGLGLGMQAGVVVAEEVGRSLTPGPLLGNALIVPTLAGSCEAPWLAELAASVSDGSVVVALSVVDAGDDPQARRLVEHAPIAIAWLRLSVSRWAACESLRVERLPDPAWRSLKPLDPTCPIAELTGTGVSSDTAELDHDATAAVVGAAQLWIAAELLGVAARAGDMSIAHAGTRRQFGNPIGAYQAVKHRIVDDYILRENAAAIVGEAAEAWDAGRPDRTILAHAARAAATAAATSSTAHCIQVLGALGFSAESTAHLAYKRVRRLACVFGDEARSRSVIAEGLVSGLAA